MKKYLVSIITVFLAVSFCACGMQTAEPVVLPTEVDEPAAIFDSGDSEEIPMSGDDWKTEFEASLLEQYSVVPERYEDLGDGWYQVYVIIEGQSVPYVAVDSATGYYHG